MQTANRLRISDALQHFESSVMEIREKTNI